MIFLIKGNIEFLHRQIKRTKLTDHCFMIQNDTNNLLGLLLFPFHYSPFAKNFSPEIVKIVQSSI